MVSKKGPGIRDWNFQCRFESRLHDWSTVVCRRGGEVWMAFLLCHHRIARFCLAAAVVVHRAQAAKGDGRIRNRTEGRMGRRIRTSRDMGFCDREILH